MANKFIVPWVSDEAIGIPAGPGADRPRWASEFQSGDSGLGEGMEALSRGIGRLGESLFGIGIQQRESAMELELIQDVQQYKMDTDAFQNGYMRDRTGQNAVNARGDAEAFHDDRFRRLEGKWGHNRAAMRYLETHAGNVMASSVDAMDRFAGAQVEGWRESVFAGQLARMGAVFANPASTEKEMADIWNMTYPMIVAHFERQGLSPQETLAKAAQMYNQALHGNVLASARALASTADPGFRAYMDGNSVAPGKRPLPPEIDTLVHEAAERHGVPAELAAAVAWAESRGDQRARSPAGAGGIMQLMPETAQELGVNPAIASENVDGGVRYLARQLEKYGGSWKHALMAYNWGPGSVDRWLKEGGAIPAETRGYLESILGGADTPSEILDPAERTALDITFESKAKENERRNQEQRFESAAATVLETLSNFESADDQFKWLNTYLNGIEGDPELHQRIRSYATSEINHGENSRRVAQEALVTEYKQKFVSGQHTLMEMSEMVNTDDRLDLDSRDKLAAYFRRGSEKENEINSGNLIELRRLIDAGEIASEQDMLLFKFDHDLTEKQWMKAVNYFREGGTLGKLSQDYVMKRFNRYYKYTPARPGMGKYPPGFYEEVLRFLPKGVTITDEMIDGTIRALWHFGENRNLFFLPDWDDYQLYEAIKENNLDEWYSEDKKFVNVETFQAFVRIMASKEWDQKTLDRARDHLVSMISSRGDMSPEDQDNLIGQIDREALVRRALVELGYGYDGQGGN
jgi:soluble lytic murein transglycosylase-like protein